MSRPGKPTDNLLIESFNRKFHEECLSVSLFLDMEYVMHKIKA
ncbi:transposase [bacterium]|nr:transposase [bacterium]